MSVKYNVSNPTSFRKAVKTGAGRFVTVMPESELEVEFLAEPEASQMALLTAAGLILTAVGEAPEAPAKKGKAAPAADPAPTAAPTPQAAEPAAAEPAAAAPAPAAAPSPEPWQVGLKK